MLVKLTKLSRYKVYRTTQPHTSWKIAGNYITENTTQTEKYFQTKTTKVLKKSKINVSIRMTTEEVPWTKSENTTSKPSNFLKPHKEKIRNTILDAWQKIWDHTSTGLFYQEIQPF